MTQPHKTLAEVLLEMGAIDRHQLAGAQQYMAQWDVPLERAVVERRFCSEDDVVRAFSFLTGYPVVQLDAETLDVKLVDVMPLSVAEQYHAVPLKVTGRRYEVLELTLVPPVNLSTVDDVLAVTKKQRAVVHLASKESTERAIARLYGKSGYVPPVAPPPVIERKVDVQNEQTFELSDEADAVSQPVLLYGWHPAAMKALGMMLERAGLPWRALDDDGLERLQPHDVVLTTTLGLRAVLPDNARLKCRLIICGSPDAADAADPADAKALGAKLYLKQPHSPEQLKKAVKKVLRPK